jgi:uncharacterized membrane protein YfcA
VFGRAVLQRTTGIGFALLAAPFLVLLLGPVEGVLAVTPAVRSPRESSCCATCARIEWRTYALLTPGALVGVGVGSVLVAVAPAAVLDVTIGLVLASALTATIRVRELTLPASPGYAALAGAVSGVMNTAAGLGGPAVTIYAIATRWRQDAFAITIQAYFFTIGSVALATKLVVGVGELTTATLLLLVPIVVCCLVGLSVGARLVGRPSPRLMRRLLYALSCLGAAATVVSGIAAATAS